MLESRLIKATIALVIIFAVFAFPTAALFADQAGLNDWTKQHVGEVRAVVPLGDRTVVATEQGALAALLNENGEILWRKVLPKQDAEVVGLLEANGLIISWTKRTVRVWSAEGQLLWDQGAEEIRDVQIVDSDSLVILTKDKLAGFSISSGSSVSKLSLDLKDSSDISALTVVNGLVRVVLPTHQDSKSVIRVIDSAGSAHDYNSLKPQFAILEKTSVAYFSSENENKIMVKNFATGKHSILNAPFSGNLQQMGNLAVLNGGKQARAIVLSKEGTPELVNIEAGAHFSKFEDNLWEFTESKTCRKFTGDDQNVVQLQEIGGGVSKGWQLSGSKMLVVQTDGSLSLMELKDNVARALWTREESLAEVVQIVSTNLPHSAAESSLGQIGFISKSVVSFANATIAMVNGITEAALKAARGGEFELKSVLESSEEERARFGFNRVLVMLTKTNKLFGIHSETGAIVWSRLLNSYVQPVLYVIHESDPDPRILVLDAKSGRAELVLTETGKISKSSASISGGKRILQAILLDAAEGEKVKTVLALAEDFSVVEYPTPSSRSATTFLHVFDKVSNQFSGYRVDVGSNRAVQNWNMAFAPNASLVSFASPGQIHDPISSPVRALGDGSLLVKHVNPNLVAAVIRDDGLKVHLIDSVTGRLVHRASHKDGSEPVHAVRFENWLVYSYWNLKANRYEIVSVTLYEKSPIGKRQLNPWTSIPKILDSNVTGFESSDLSILQRLYVLPGTEITALGVTTTLRGIAAKNLLVGLGGTGQVLMLDQRLIDPRRTNQAPTEEEKLEGLFQYFPELPMNPTHVLSYYRGAGERGARLFYVAPSMLESTCTVVAAGLDIFKGRASPSGTFDLLAEDFNYALLVLLILTLAVCVVVLRGMERRKTLEAAWT